MSLGRVVFSSVSPSPRTSWTKTPERNSILKLHYDRLTPPASLRSQMPAKPETKPGERHFSLGLAIRSSVDLNPNPKPIWKCYLKLGVDLRGSRLEPHSTIFVNRGGTDTYTIGEVRSRRRILVTLGQQQQINNQQDLAKQNRSTNNVDWVGCSAKKDIEPRPAVDVPCLRASYVLVPCVVYSSTVFVASFTRAMGVQQWGVHHRPGCVHIPTASR